MTKPHFKHEINEQHDRKTMLTERWVQVEMILQVTLASNHISPGDHISPLILNLL